MIELAGVSKTYKTDAGKIKALQDVSLSIGRGERVGVLGTHASGKSALVRLLNGAELPSRGQVRRSMSVSWPMSLSQAVLQSTLTGHDNLRFISRIYGRPYQETLAFVRDFSGIGEFMELQVKTYPPRVRQRLIASIYMAFDFDCYVIDENIPGGDRDFREKFETALVRKFERKALFVTTGKPDMIEQYCERVLLLHRGQVIDQYKVAMGSGWRARWQALMATLPASEQATYRATEEEEPEETADDGF